MTTVALLFAHGGIISPSESFPLVEEYACLASPMMTSDWSSPNDDLRMANSNDVLAFSLLKSVLNVSMTCRN